MTVKMAVPNKGRLNERAIELITKAGIQLGDDWGRKLNIHVPDLDLEVFFIRAQDIPVFIDSGAVDFGITGQDVEAEAGKKLTDILDLNFGQCRLAIAAPDDSEIAKTGKMKDGIRVATSFPKLTKKFFDAKGIKADIVFVQGAAEIMPLLGVSDCIADLVATGGTLRMNHLVEVVTIIESQASVFTSKAAMKDAEKKRRITEIVDAIRSVLDAEGKKYLMADVPKKRLKEVERIVPGIGGPTVIDLAGNDDCVAIQVVIAAEDSYRIVAELKKIGAKGILTIPIERLVE
ncbi:ATP phosphoribosyltransferase [Thermoplasmatales archaeon BRNA1]|nr:ATP phosphoribosyltransferase [Thermoplasmatales archaeon BRNA1]